MFANPLWIWIALGAAIVLVVVLLIAAGARKARTENLREHFGSEYDRAVRAKGSRNAAEDDLVARAEEAKSFEIRSLTAAERDRYLSEWKKVEAHFVERPTTAVVEADELLRDAMRTRGYPIADFEKYSDLLSVKHPRVVEHYRAGHKAIEARASSTEDLRQAMLHYRALFDELVGTTKGDVVGDIEPAREIERRDENRA